MTHEHAWTRLPDLLDDRDQPQLLAHVAACHHCQRQLFLLSRVDRALRSAAGMRRKERRRIRKVRWLRFPAGLVAAAVAALVFVFFVPHHAAPGEFTLRTAAGRPIGHARLNRPTLRTPRLRSSPAACRPMLATPLCSGPAKTADGCRSAASWSTRRAPAVPASTSPAGVVGRASG